MRAGLLVTSPTGLGRQSATRHAHARRRHFIRYTAIPITLGKCYSFPATGQRFRLRRTRVVRLTRDMNGPIHERTDRDERKGVYLQNEYKPSWRRNRGALECPARIDIIPVYSGADYISCSEQARSRPDLPEHGSTRCGRWVNGQHVRDRCAIPSQIYQEAEWRGCERPQYRRPGNEWPVLLLA